MRSVAPAISALAASARVIRHRRIKCFGVGESQLEAMLPDLIRRGREPSVGITVSDATITLRITAAGDDDAACQAAMEPTVATSFANALGTIVFGEEDDELEHVVAAAAARAGQDAGRRRVGDRRARRGLAAGRSGERFDNLERRRHGDGTSAQLDACSILGP